MNEGGGERVLVNLVYVPIKKAGWDSVDKSHHCVPVCVSFAAVCKNICCKTYYDTVDKCLLGCLLLIHNTSITILHNEYEYSYILITLPFQRIEFPFVQSTWYMRAPKGTFAMKIELIVDILPSLMKYLLMFGTLPFIHRYIGIGSFL